MNKTCFCGAKLAFSACCEPIIQQLKQAQTAEQLMRSRFSAFYTQHEQWLLASWEAPTKPPHIHFDDDLKWLDLTIIKSTLIDESHSSVEFEARYLKADKVSAIHEHSRFIKHQQQWFYVEGDYLKPTFKAFKLGRNDNCPCGSGRKYKHCCAC